METVIYVIAAIIAIVLDVCSLAMLVRALLPLFFDAEGSRVYLFVCLITEPFIIPVRFLLHKFNLLQNSPIDWSFTITYMLIALIRVLLPVF